MKTHFCQLHTLNITKTVENPGRIYNLDLTRRTSRNHPSNESGCVVGNKKGLWYVEDHVVGCGSVKLIEGHW